MVQAAFARVAAAVVGVLLAWSPPAAGAEPVAAAMRIQDLSQSTRCAEDDNVYVALSGGDVRRFAIVAEHPRYMTPDMPDFTPPYFNTCAITSHPQSSYPPFDGVLWAYVRTPNDG